MRLASVITPFNDRNLALAAETWVTNITVRYQGPELADWLPAREQVERHGLKICTVEDALQTDEIIMGTAGRDEEIEARCLRRPRNGSREALVLWHATQTRTRLNNSLRT